MDKNTIYNSFLLLAEQQQKLLQNAQQLNECFYNFFRGATESKQNTNKNMPIISLEHNQGDELMKFQGKTIHKNTKCNTWYTRYRVDGKQYYISGKTQREVLTTLKQKLNYVKKEKSKILTLQEWYNQWLELFKINNVKESTLDVYKSLIKHIPDSILQKDIKQITSIEIQKLINSITLSRTKQKLYEFINDIFDKAEKHNICKNIVKIIEKPKHTRKNGIALTEKDKQIFINYCMQNKHYIFVVTLYQGLRKSEALGITPKDIDFNIKTLDINKTWNDKGKFDSTKNTPSDRVMPLFEPTIKVLKNLDIKRNGRVFNFSNAKMQDDFTNIIEKLKLNPKYTIHSLRHTFITNCQDSGIPEHIIQSWVGHQIGSNVTKQVYTHIQNESNLLNINKLNNSKFYSNSTHI